MLHLFNDVKMCCLSFPKASDRSNKKLNDQSLGEEGQTGLGGKENKQEEKSNHEREKNKGEREGDTWGCSVRQLPANQTQS